MLYYSKKFKENLLLLNVFEKINLFSNQSTMKLEIQISSALATAILNLIKKYSI